MQNNVYPKLQGKNGETIDKNSGKKYKLSKCKKKLLPKKSLKKL